MRVSLALLSQGAKHFDKTWLGHTSCSFAGGLNVKKILAWWLQGRQQVQNKVLAEREVVFRGGRGSVDISNTCIMMSGVRFS